MGKIEDLLVDMKTDVTRLPAELSKIPCVSKQLKLDELSTLTKMAARGEVVPASVITQAPPTTTSVISGGSEKAMKLQSSQNQYKHSSSLSSSAMKRERPLASQEVKRIKTEDKTVTLSSSQYAHALTTASLIPISANSGLRLQQTAEGGLLLATSSLPYTALQQQQQQQQSRQLTKTSSSVTEIAGASAGGSTSYAVKVPTFVDSSQVYQATTVQLVPVSAGQQIMVWPQAMVQQQQQQGKVTPQQLTVVQGSQLISMVDASSTATNATQGQKGSATTATNASIITID